MMLDLESHRPTIKINLTARQIPDQLIWATTHRNWTIRDWEPVLPIDKPRFCLDVTDKCARVWPSPNDRLHAAKVAKHNMY